MLGLFAAGCGDDDSSSSSGGDSGATIIRGTTDQPISYDPAGAYDLPSYDGIYSMYQNLLTVPPGGNKAEPEAAESCDYTDEKSQVFECTMRDGLKFSDGSDLTAEDVVFSFERNIGIADPNGASSLLANMKSIEAPDDKTVVFNLKAPDATWPLVVTAASFAIVPSDIYPEDELQPNEEVVGSGRYVLDEYTSGQQTVMSANPEYTGEDPPLNERVVIKYFDKAAPLKLAVERAASTSPTAASARPTSRTSKVPTASTWSRATAPRSATSPSTRSCSPARPTRRSSPSARPPLRSSIARRSPRTSTTARSSRSTRWSPRASTTRRGRSPTPTARSPTSPPPRQTLADAGVDTPVELELWWTPTHYGTSSGDEYAEIKRQLDGSGLFDVTLKSTEWNQYSTAAFTDKYPAYQLGWFPDYPDADDYTSPFFLPDSFLNIHYENPEMIKLLAEEKASDDEDVRSEAFDQIQTIAAEDVPTVPIWQADQVAAVRDGIEGVEDTFDPSFIFRFWLISKS